MNYKNILINLSKFVQKLLIFYKITANKTINTIYKDSILLIYSSNK